MPVDPETAERLRRLAPSARQARRQHRPDSPQGRASAEFTDLLESAHREGATVRELSNASGISYHSVARRLRIRLGGPIKPPPEPTALTGNVAPVAGQGGSVSYLPGGYVQHTTETLEAAAIDTDTPDEEQPHPAATKDSTAAASDNASAGVEAPAPTDEAPKW